MQRAPRRVERNERRNKIAFFGPRVVERKIFCAQNSRCVFCCFLSRRAFKSFTFSGESNRGDESVSDGIRSSCDQYSIIQIQVVCHSHTRRFLTMNIFFLLRNEAFALSLPDVKKCARPSEWVRKLEIIQITEHRRIVGAPTTIIIICLWLFSFSMSLFLVSHWQFYVICD